MTIKYHNVKLIRISKLWEKDLFKWHHKILHEQSNILKTLKNKTSQQRNWRYKKRTTWKFYNQKMQ
jgi:hypothetical protein